MPSQAWTLAEEAAERAGVTLRPLESLRDADEVLRVMVATWGPHQLVPREMILALGESGNVPWLAVSGGDVVGYVLGWTGVGSPDGLHVHSHMLAALPDRRHRGVGYALKLAQRAQALDQGIRVVRWTFDPLVARNAYFNLGKLGTVADRFGRDFYGEMTDALNRGDRSDRLVVRWDLDRAPGPRTVSPAERVVLVRRDGEEPAPQPRTSGAAPSPQGALLEIPQGHAGIRERDAALARSWRDAVADALETCLSLGLVAVGFDRTSSTYVMAPDPGTES